MKLWFIKLGKAFSALRREGLVRGGKRILASFWALFRRVGKGDVLIITGGLGDSARYRAWHVGEELTLHGIPAQIAVQDNPFLSQYVSRFSVFVFHRVMVTPAIQKMIARIKQQHKTILFDTDDLVYDAQYFRHMDMFQNMNAFEKMQYAGGVSAEIVNDPYVAVCTTSTNYLAKKLRERGKKVFVVCNKLSKEDVEIACNVKRVTHNIGEEDKNKESKDIGDIENESALSDATRYTLHVTRIGYFSGTKSHDKDFAVAVPALIRILEKYPQTKLMLVGPLAQGNDLEKFRSRIESLPYVPRREHFGNIARCDINIAPLEMGNPFCEAKSPLKFFEAGIVGVPTVASATEPFCDAITEGEDGFLARDEKEWFEKLSRLVENPELRHSMGEKARQTALVNFTTERAENEEYYGFVKSKVRKVHKVESPSSPSSPSSP